MGIVVRCRPRRDGDRKKKETHAGARACCEALAGHPALALSLGASGRRSKNTVQSGHAVLQWPRTSAPKPPIPGPGRGPSAPSGAVTAARAPPAQGHAQQRAIGARHQAGVSLTTLLLTALRIDFGHTLHTHTYAGTAWTAPLGCPPTRARLDTKERPFPVFVCASPPQRMPQRPRPASSAKFLRVGAPLVLLVTGGWYCLTSVIAGKIEVKVWRAHFNAKRAQTVTTKHAGRRCRR